MRKKWAANSDIIFFHTCPEQARGSTKNDINQRFLIFWDKRSETMGINTTQIQGLKKIITDEIGF